MKFKIVPGPPDSLEGLSEMHTAVPIVPDDEPSCCARLLQRTGVGSQDRAKEWLTFLRALELVNETGGKYHRIQRDSGIDALQKSFRERVYLVDDVLSVLSAADEPLDSAAVFERVEDRLPHWERLRHTDPEAVWRERVRRLLEWAVLFEMVERVDGGYRRA